MGFPSRCPVNHIWEGASIETHGKGSSNDADGVLSPLGTVALPPLSLMKLHAGGVKDITRRQMDLINEWIGDTFMSQRRMSVKFAVAKVLLFDMGYNEGWTAAQISKKAESYLAQSIIVNPNSASSILNAFINAGKVTFTIESGMKGKRMYRRVG